MNTNPKFAVGERVMVRTQTMKRLNSDNARVVNRKYVDIFRCRMTGDLHIGGYWIYTLSNTDGAYLWEPALRPRPKAGDDFKTLIRGLKLEQGEPA